MTYNLRCDTPSDPFTWQQRRAPLMQQILEQSPAVLGAQEVLPHQLVDLTRGLAGYAFVGVSRGPNQADAPYNPGLGEFNPLFFRTEQLTAVHSGTFWLSATPGIAGSRGQHASLPRISTWALFEAATGGNFYVFNTHFPHESGPGGRSARAFAARVLLEQINALTSQAPVILLGDMNFDRRDPEEKRAVSEQLEVRFEDAFSVAAQRLGPYQTFPGFQVNGPAGPRIDYIWVSVSPAIDVERYAVLEQRTDSYHYSDHLAVTADLRLP